MPRVQDILPRLWISVRSSAIQYIRSFSAMKTPGRSSSFQRTPTTHRLLRPSPAAKMHGATMRPSAVSVPSVDHRPRSLPTMLSYGLGNEQIHTVTAGVATWFTHDHLGSTRQTVTSSGTVLGSARYDAWGVPLENTTGSRVGFTGELTDNGLVYLRARWYNPSTGTFTSRDPFPGVDTVPQSLHPYAYTHNNPVNATDPSGMNPWFDDQRRCDPLTEIYDIVQKRCMPRARKPGFEPALPTPNGSSLKERANAATERALRGETATASLTEGALRQPGRDTKGLGVGLGIGIAALCALLLTGELVDVDTPRNEPRVPTPTPTPRVNLDANTVFAFVADSSPIRAELQAYVQGKQMIITRTAFIEINRIVTTIGGPTERARAITFMTQVKEVEDDPSERALNLRSTGNLETNDIIIFGTGDRLNVTTMTSDAKAIRAAKEQGVLFNVYLHIPVSLKGK
jgi:RHS repeat-associated protein